MDTSTFESKDEAIFKDVVVEVTLDLDKLQKIPNIGHKLQKLKQNGKVSFSKNEGNFKLRGPDLEIQNAREYMLKINESVTSLLTRGITNAHDIQRLFNGRHLGKCELFNNRKCELTLDLISFVSFFSKHGDEVRRMLQRYSSEIYVKSIKASKVVLIAKGSSVLVANLEKFLLETCDTMQTNLDIFYQKVSVEDRNFFLDSIESKFQPDVSILHGVHLHLGFPRYRLGSLQNIGKDISKLEQESEFDTLSSSALRDLLDNFVQKVDTAAETDRSHGCSFLQADDCFGLQRITVGSNAFQSDLESASNVNSPKDNNSLKSSLTNAPEHTIDEIDISKVHNLVNENRSYLGGKAKLHNVTIFFVENTKIKVEGGKPDVQLFVDSIKVFLDLTPRLHETRDLSGTRKLPDLGQPMSLSSTFPSTPPGSRSWQRLSSSSDLGTCEVGDSMSTAKLTSTFTRYYHPGTGIKIHIGISDITKMETDCIVNAANRDLQHYGGVAYAISKGAGYKLEDECVEIIKKHGSLKVADVCSTTAGNLPCKRVLHTVGPIWSSYTRDGDCTDQLQEVFTNCLNMADELKMSSIAFPAISSGIYGVPTYQVTRASCEAICMFCLCHSDSPSCVKDIYLVDLGHDTIDSFNAVFMLQVSQEVFSRVD